MPYSTCETIMKTPCYWEDTGAKVLECWTEEFIQESKKTLRDRAKSYMVGDLGESVLIYSAENGEGLYNTKAVLTKSIADVLRLLKSG